MEGFYLLCAHLLGDFILQNDWMASNKTAPHPGPDPCPNLRQPGKSEEYPGPYSLDADPLDREGFGKALVERNEKIANYKVQWNAYRLGLQLRAQWIEKQDKWWTGNFACALHCLIYTLAVWAMSYWWVTPLGLAVCFAAHYMIDRYRLVRPWMTLMGQEAFLMGPLAPWSSIVVDNTLHLLTLAAIAWCTLH